MKRAINSIFGSIGIFFVLMAICLVAITLNAFGWENAVPLVYFATTLAVDKPRTQVLGDLNDIPIIADEIIYEGAAVGIVVGTGHARPLVGGDAFAGFAQTKCDNSGGAAAAKNVKVIRKGRAVLSVASVAITDIGALVYATDDDTFVLTTSPTSSVIGKVARFVSSGVADVEFEAHFAS